MNYLSSIYGFKVESSDWNLISKILPFAIIVSTLVLRFVFQFSFAKAAVVSTIGTVVIVRGYAMYRKSKEPKK